MSCYFTFIMIYFKLISGGKLIEATFNTRIMIIIKEFQGEIHAGERTEEQVKAHADAILA